MGIMQAFVTVRNMLQTSPSLPSWELEEIKVRIKALEVISEENEDKFDDIYVALTELSMNQKLVAKHRNPIGYLKPKEWFSPENKIQCQKSDKIIMLGDYIFAICELRIIDSNCQVDMHLEFCQIINFILCVDLSRFTVLLAHFCKLAIIYKHHWSGYPTEPK